MTHSLLEAAAATLASASARLFAPLTLAIGLLGCSPSAPLDPAAGLLPGPPSANAGARQCEELLIGMDDGVHLYARGSHFGPEDPRPLLLLLTPYRNTVCPTETVHAYASQNGQLSPELTSQLAMLNVSMRGTGSSEGLFEHLGPRTQQDIRSVVEWVSQQPWSNGSIVVMGHSGTGFEEVFALDDPHVKAVFARSTCFDTYRGCFRPGGADNAVSDVYAAVITAAYALGLEARLRLGLALNPTIPEQLAALDAAVLEIKSRDVYDDWWQARGGLDRAAATQVPVYYGTDGFDILPSSGYVAFERTANAWLSLGWGHTSEETLLNTPSAGEVLRGPVERFVRRYALGENTGIEQAPRLQLVTTLGDVDSFIAGKVLVRGEPRWPLPGTRWTRLYLDAGPSGSALSRNDGRLALAPGAAATDTAPLVSGPSVTANFRTAQSAAAHGYENNAAPQAVAPLANLRANEALALTYTTEPLTQDVELSGPIVLNLHASATATDFDWAVNLTDVWPEGRSEWISDGFLRASLRRVDELQSGRNGSGDIIRPWYPFDSKEPVPKGEVVRYLIELTPISNVFRAGHRIRLDLFPTASGLLDSVLTGGSGTLTIYRGVAQPSSLLLPLIPARCQLGVPLVAGVEMPTRCVDTLNQALAH